MIFASTCVFIKSMTAGKHLFTASNPTMVHDKLEVVSIPLVKLGCKEARDSSPMLLTKSCVSVSMTSRATGNPWTPGLVGRSSGTDGVDNDNA